jgi:glycosyltransferase involved in cell wall biosynthesis
MAAGIPVVGDSGSFNAIPGFQDGVHGIVANDAESMTGAVLRLLGDDKARTEMAAAANTLVREHFSWEDRITAVAHKLQMLVAEHQARPDSAPRPAGHI